MRDDFNPFLQNTFPLDVLRERSTIIEQLTWYVVGDWRDIYRGTPDPRAAEFRQSAAGLVAQHFIQYFEVTKRAQKLMRDPGDTIELVLDAFAEVGRLADEEDYATPLFRNEALVAAFEQRFKTSIVPLSGDAKPSVLGAFQASYGALRQAKARRVSLSALVCLLQANEHSQPSIVHFGALQQHLFERIGYFTRNVLLFSGLLGGQTHAQMLKMVARDMCHKEDPDGIQFSIMHYLTADGSHPGSYASKADDDFRADIRAKYDAL